CCNTPPKVWVRPGQQFEALAVDPPHRLAVPIIKRVRFAKCTVNAPEIPRCRWPLQMLSRLIERIERGKEHRAGFGDGNGYFFDVHASLRVFESRIVKIQLQCITSGLRHHPLWQMRESGHGSIK